MRNRQLAKVMSLIGLAFAFWRVYRAWFKD